MLILAALLNNPVYAQSVEDLDDTGILLHGDDSELILLVNPDEESLGIVVEDTSVLWPFSLKSS